MIQIRFNQVVVLLIFAELVSALLNTTVREVSNDLKIEKDEEKIKDKDTKLADTRRQAKKERSTSSSSGEKRDRDDANAAESLDFSESKSSSGHLNKGSKKYHPKSSVERKGWRKWHRKCTPCSDQNKKWRDPSISWVCGGYQRARRSFKSMCMMRYRNCQDGTMFVKIHNNRCKNSSSTDFRPYGEYFFYDYVAKLSGDSSKSYDTDSASSGAGGSKSSSTSKEIKIL